MRTLATLGVTLPLMSVTAPSAEEISLAGDWRFASDEADAGLSQQWQSPGWDDSAWALKPVPADWGPFDGIGWYRTAVDFPSVDQLAGRSLYLVFDGVDDESRVWVDGQLVAECNTWNRRFFADVTARAGSRAVLAVRVVDHGLGGGVWAPVRLVLTADRTELLAGPWHTEPAIDVPDWLPGSVIYEVFPRTFSETGDFEGVRRRLDELHDLGVDVLWLMPIHPIGERHRKGTLGSPYASRDHMAINPDYGTGDDLRRLVDDAHQRGMRVIIDAVLNHCSPDNPLTRTHRDWFQLDAGGNPVADNPDWWDIVDFDWENREVWDYFNTVMEHWVREFDIDGYRCDVASLMPTEYWEQLLPRLQALEPGVLMLAESDAPDLHRASFHVSYNWTLWDAMGPVFRGERPASHLADAIEQDFYTFQRGALRMAFAENHDKERATVEFGSVPAGRLASLITLTICSTPLIHNGQEAGASEPRDIFEPYTIDWSDPHGLRPFFRRLIELRRQSEALRLGDCHPLAIEPRDSLFAFQRTHGDHTALILANVTSDEITVSGAGLAPVIGPGAVPSALATSRWSEDGQTLTLAPHTGDLWLVPSPVRED